MTTMREWMYDVREWKILLASVVVQGAFAYVFHRVGARRAAQGRERDTSVIASLQAAVLGLLALMSGFTFSMALSRFEGRKLLMVQEANVITTTALRAQLPGVSTTGAMHVLQSYVAERLVFGDSYGVDKRAFAAARDNSERLHDELWQYALEASKADPHSQSAALFTQSVNELIDTHDDRVAALDNHVPQVVIGLLHFIAIIGMALTGFASGLSGARARFATGVVIVLVTTVIMVITDLDRPQMGIIRIKQQPMIDAQAQLAKTAAQL